MAQVKELDSTTAQVKKSTLKNGNPINEERQFGKPNGNPRNPSGWKKEDTLRYKWEQMLKLDAGELQAVLENPKASKVERITAEVLLDSTMKSYEKLASLEKLANQVYGMPKQVNENKNIEIKPILPMKDKK